MTAPFEWKWAERRGFALRVMDQPPPPRPEDLMSALALPIPMIETRTLEWCEVYLLTGAKGPRCPWRHWREDRYFLRWVGWVAWDAVAETLYVDDACRAQGRRPTLVDVRDVVGFCRQAVT